MRWQEINKPLWYSGQTINLLGFITKCSVPRQFGANWYFNYTVVYFGSKIVNSTWENYSGWRIGPLMMHNDDNEQWLCLLLPFAKNETGLKMESGLDALVAIISDVIQELLCKEGRWTRHAQRPENNRRLLISGTVCRVMLSAKYSAKRPYKYW